MQKPRPYLTVENFKVLESAKQVPIYLDSRQVKSVRLCRLQPKRYTKYTLTFVDSPPTIVNKGTRLYFDVH